MHLDANDTVPALRSNLLFSHSPHGLGTGFLTLKNVDNGDELRLHGFEVSLARMLDGHRTAGELLKSANQLGMPVTPEDLDGFVTRLEDRKLINAGDVEPDAGDLQVFPKRQVWEEKSRDLYRLALREGRLGNLNSALVTLDCLLHDRPDLDEAYLLRERLEKLKREPALAEQRFDRVFADAEQQWKPEPVEKVGLSWKTSKIAAAALIAVGSIALAAAFVPLPHTVTKDAMLVPAASAKLVAARSGVVAAVDVKQGQWVDQDAVLYQYDVTEQQAQLADAVKVLERANRGQYDRLPKTPEAQAARTRYDVAGAMLGAAQADLEHQRELESDSVYQAEDTLNYALNEVTAARIELDEMVPEEDREELLAAKSEVQMLELAMLESEVRAPLAGIVTHVGIEPGQALTQGATAMQIDDSRQLKAVATLTPRERKGLHVGQPVLVLSNGRALNTTIENTSAGSVEMRFENQDLAFAPGVAEVQIRGNPVPLIR